MAADEAGVTIGKAKDVIHAYQAILADALGNDGAAEIPGIGTLKKKFLPERDRRNPKTGGTVHLPEGCKVIFRATRHLDDVLNGRAV